MGLFSPRRAAPPPPAPEPQPEPQQHHSPALRDLLHGLHPEQRPLVLDLGPAVGGNIERLAERGARVLVADLPRGLRAAGVELPLREPARLERLLPRLDEPLAAVLLWDLLNVLAPQAITALGARLAERCAPGAALLAMIYTHKNLPQTLPRFRIVDHENLAYELDPRPGAAAPRYHEPDLERMLKAFRVDSTSILRNGLQEYLLIRR